MLKSLPLRLLLVAAFLLMIASSPSSFAQTSPEIITFRSSDTNVAMDVFPAPKPDSPCVLVLHGSSGLGSGRDIFRPIASGFAGLGFHTYLLHYFDKTRTTYAGETRIQRSSKDWMQTITEAIEVIQKQHPGAHVGVFGYSLGAYLAMAQAANDSRVEAVVELAGGYRGETPKKFPPTLILHGDADQRVPPAEAKKLRQLLVETGSPYEEHFYSGEGHILSPISYLDVITRGASFFERHLR